MELKLTERMIFKRKNGVLRGTAYRTVKNLGEIKATVTQSPTEITLNLSCIPFSALDIPPTTAADMDDADRIINEYITECVELRNAIPADEILRARHAHDSVLNAAIQKILTQIRSQKEPQNV
ncbi:MAG: hypothetical protein IJX39_04890 [Clostridia bacterium]|nr:hypothetical protein [Clostridia bacterium]